MTSALDLIEKKYMQESGVELLEEEEVVSKPKTPKFTSAVDLIEKKYAPPPTTTVPVEIESIEEKKFSPDLMMQEYKDDLREWFSKSGGTKNFGIGVYDKDREDLNLREKTAGVIGETLQGLSDLSTHPLETLRGGVEIIANMPGFSVGLVDAAGMGVKEIINQISQGKFGLPGLELLPGESSIEPMNFEDVYFAMSEGMHRSMKALEPDLSLMFGERTPTSNLASQVVMTPLTTLSTLGNSVAEWEGFEDWPNIRGASRFLGDILGMAAMGFLLHGRSSRADFARNTEKVVKKADEIARKERVVKESTGNELLKQTQQKILDIQKQQLELEAQRIMESVSKDALIREELGLQAETIAKEKLRPLQGKEDAVFVSKKGNEYRKIDGEWFDGDGKKVTNHFVIKAAERGKKVTDLTKIETSAIEIFPDMLETAEGYIALSHFTPKEQASLRKAGIVTEATSRDGTKYDAVDPEMLWRRREQIQEERSKPSKPPSVKMMVTKADKKKLKDLGYKEEQIKKMKPAEVQEILEGEPKQVVETIESSATKHPETGKVYTGIHHGESMKKAGIPFNDPSIRSPIGKADEVNGFVTNTGRFVSREEALEIARKADQTDITGTKKLAQDDLDAYKYAEEGKPKTIKKFKPLEKEPEVKPEPEPKPESEAKKIEKEELEFNKKELAKLRKELKEVGEELGKTDAKDPRAQELELRQEEILDQIEAYRPKPKAKPEPEPPPEAESAPITSLDRSTGVDVPGLEGIESPFFQSLEKAKEFKDIYLERKKAAKENVEMFTQKLINDVNQWYHDIDVIPIDQVRDALSNLAARADELRAEFITSQDHLVWKETVEEAATWARRLEREGVKELTREEKIDKLYDTLNKAKKAKKGKKSDKGKELSPRDKLDRYSAISDMANVSGGATAVPTILKHKDKFSKAELEKLTEYFTKVGSNRQRVEDVARELDIENLIDFDGKDVTVGKKKPKTVLRKKGEKGGQELYDIGGATAEGTKVIMKKISRLYKSAKAKGKEARGVKDFRPKEAVKKLIQELTRDWLDRSGNIRSMMLDKLGDAGYRALQGLYTAKGSGALAYSKLKQMEKEVYGGLPNSVKTVVDDLIFHSRILDIAKYKTPKEFKELNKYTPEESIVFLEMFGEMEGFTPEFARKLYHVREDGSIGGRVGAYFDHMRQMLDDMLKAELITKEEYDNLAAHNYRRMKVVEVFDKKRPSLTKKGVSVYDSGVESLAKGRESTIFERNARIMALEVFNRAYGRILNNEANKNLLEIARKDKENPFVRVKESKEDKIPSGWRKQYMYEEGKRKTIFLSPEMSKEWIAVNPETTFKYSQLLRYSTLSPVLRFFATGINWGFAVANLPRDVMHTWFASRMFKDGEWSSVYSPTLPVYALQMGADQAGIFSDALLRRGKYQKYIDEGGGMEFLTHQGRIWQKGKHLEGPVDKFYNFMGYFGETSEIMTRLAIRDRVIKRRAKERGITVEEARKDKSITKEATFVARDYMDFSQGGGLSKALDNGLPYLNASIQGTRGMFRAFKPGSGTALSSTYKLAQFAALTTGSYIAFKARAPETMKALEGNIATTNNYVIPLGDQYSFEDSRGQKRYMFFKIPLDPGQKFFKTFFEASADKWLGNEVDVGRVTAALKEHSPVGVSSLPPSVSGTLGYYSNKDFWLGEDIWKQEGPFSYERPEWLGGDPKVGSKVEFTKRTPQAMRDLGKFTGLSPERAKYAIEEVVTSGSMYSYLAGQAYDAVHSEMPEDMRKKHIAEVLSEAPIVSRFFGITNPYSKHAEKIDKSQEAYEVRRFVENQKLDLLAEGYLFRDSVKRKEIFDYIAKSKDLDTADRLRERFRFQEVTKDLPERSFWMRLQGVAVEVRAKMFVDRLEEMSSDEQSQIWKEYDIISRAKGVISPRFRREVAKEMGRIED